MYLFWNSFVHSRSYCARCFSSSLRFLASSSGRWGNVSTQYLFVEVRNTSLLLLTGRCVYGDNIMGCLLQTSEWYMSRWLEIQKVFWCLINVSSPRLNTSGPDTLLFPSPSCFFPSITTSGWGIIDISINQTMPQKQGSPDNQSLNTIHHDI